MNEEDAKADDDGWGTGFQEAANTADQNDGVGNAGEQSWTGFDQEDKPEGQPSGDDFGDFGEA